MAATLRVVLVALVLAGAAVAAVVLAQPLLLFLVALAVVAYLVATLRARPAGTPDVTAPVAVPPEEAELAEGPVWACMRCGSTRVRRANLSEGGIPGGGAGLDSICARCRHRGPPLEFDSVTAYREFVKALNEREEPREP